MRACSTYINAGYRFDFGECLKAKPSFARPKVRNSDVLETAYHHRKTPGAFIFTHHVFLLRYLRGHTSSRRWATSYGTSSLVRIRVCDSPCGPFQTRIHTLLWTNREAFQVESPRRGRWYVSLKISLSLMHHSFFFFLSLGLFFNKNPSSCSLPSNEHTRKPRLRAAQRTQHHNASLCPGMSRCFQHQRGILYRRLRHWRSCI